MTKGKSLPPAVRGAIIALHVCAEKTWDEICTDLQVLPVTAQRIYERVKDRVGEDASIHALLDAVEDEKRTEPAVPQKVPQGSIESEKMKELALKDSEYWQMTFPEIATEAGVEVSRSQAYKIMTEHHNLGRYKPRHKPKLGGNDESSRIEFAEWALQQPLNSFAFTDESWFEAGRSRSHHNITRPKGANPYDYIINPDPPVFSLMVSTCIALGYKGKLYIWEKETLEERASNNAELEEENKRKKQRVSERRTFASIPGTQEYQHLQEVNANIRQYNNTRQLGQPRRMPRRPEWEFGEETSERSVGEGFDWFLYRKHVLHDIAYPLIEQIQKDKGIRVWLVKDNAGNHTLATRMDIEEAQKRGIYSIPHRGQPCPIPGIPFWPANSPDLNEIEPVWQYLKDEMSKRPRPQGKSRRSIEAYKTALQEEWENMPQELIDRYCLRFHASLEKIVENNGRNNFNA